VVVTPKSAKKPYKDFEILMKIGEQKWVYQIKPLNNECENSRK
jgi:hypothetical protein